MSYLLNKLQPLPFATPVIVTLNPPFDPDPALTLREFEYSHPLQDAGARAAQDGFAALQGLRHTWYAGAWLGYGFHEDGLESAHDGRRRHRAPNAVRAAGAGARAHRRLIAMHAERPPPRFRAPPRRRVRRARLRSPHPRSSTAK